MSADGLRQPGPGLAAEGEVGKPVGDAARASPLPSSVRFAALLACSNSAWNRSVSARNGILVESRQPPSYNCQNIRVTKHGRATRRCEITR